MPYALRKMSSINYTIVKIIIYCKYSYFNICSTFQYLR